VGLIIGVVIAAVVVIIVIIIIVKACMKYHSTPAGDSALHSDARPVA